MNDKSFAEEIDHALHSIFVDRQTPSQTLEAAAGPYLSYVSDRFRWVRLDAEVDRQDRDLQFLSSAFLDAAAGGYNGIADATVGKRVGETLGMSARTIAISRAAKARALSVLNPFTGATSPVRHSIGREWHCLFEEGEYVLVSQIAGIMVTVHLETVWVFPERKLILCVSNGLSQSVISQDIADTIARCVRHGERLADYLRDVSVPKEVLLSDFSCPHMSHNLWNIQTGWSNLYDLNCLGFFDHFFVFKDQNFFGELDELYGDVVAKETITHVNSDEELFEAALNRKALLLTVKDELFTASFADRILRRARSKCSPDFLCEVEKLKESCDPLIVTTIRLDNRAWIEQKEGLAELFSMLAQEFPRLGLVIDGLSSDSAKGWTTGWMSMDAELEVAEYVKAHLGGLIPVMFAVGRTFAESIVLNDAADMFVAPSGSGMALYKWISNKPGFAFSNRSVLDPESPHKWPLRVWHDTTFRHDLVPTEHLSAGLVQDGDVMRDHISRANFHAKAADIFKAALPLVKAVMAAKS